MSSEVRRHREYLAGVSLNLFFLLTLIYRELCDLLHPGEEKRGAWRGWGGVGEGSISHERFSWEGTSRIYPLRAQNPGGHSQTFPHVHGQPHILTTHICKWRTFQSVVVGFPVFTFQTGHPGADIGKPCCLLLATHHLRSPWCGEAGTICRGFSNSPQKC